MSYFIVSHTDLFQRFTLLCLAYDLPLFFTSFTMVDDYVKDSHLNALYSVTRIMV